jgi:hypothetical protein
LEQCSDGESTRFLNHSHTSEYLDV